MNRAKDKTPLAIISRRISSIKGRIFIFGAALA